MPATPLTSTLGILLSRLLVPGWLLTGALFKLYYRSPRNLPQTIWETADGWGIDLIVLLRAIVCAELIIAGIMFLSKRWARTVAIALMIGFCLILLSELFIFKASSCGCLGKVTMPSTTMLLIDLPLLLGLLAFAPRYRTRPEQTAAPRSFNPLPAAMAVLWLLASAGVAFGLPEPKSPNPGSHHAEDTDGDDGGQGGGDSDTGASQAGDGTPPVEPADGTWQLPAYHVPSIDKWTGQRWEDLDIYPFLRKQPVDINVGRRYIIFYSPSCDHCYDLLLQYFENTPPVPTTVVSIPEFRDRFETEGTFPMPCGECEKLELRIGCEYLATPPIVVALEDGVVVCAFENEEPHDPQCLHWH